MSDEEIIARLTVYVDRLLDRRCFFFSIWAGPMSGRSMITAFAKARKNV
jgi:hypothetical protein